MNITPNDIYNLIHQGESTSVEIKKCSDSLPRSVWETYSAFANTRGGVILLGITEHKDRPLESRFEITGVSDPDKIETDFFNILNNRQKVSRNILFDSDFRPVEIEGKTVIYISVPEADYHKKPIYINDNIVDGSYKRSHEGDRRLDKEGLSMMLRDSTDDIDSQILEHYGLEDIDEETLRGYRQVFDTANPGHAYTNLDNKEFLYRMGGYDYDRHREIEGLTIAGLMMFGKGTPIEKRFPLFRMDYLDLLGVKPGGDLKWNDRLTYDGRWENNLYNFVTMTMRKLLFTLPSEGRIVGEARRDGGPLYDGIREAIINSVTYSDFQTEGVLRIDRRDNEIILRNPGLLRISADRIYNGDFTHARNRNIQKMFRMIGYGDNIGSGFQKILAAWNTLGYLRPDLKELEDVKEVWLSLPLVSSSKKDEGTSNNDSTVNSTAKHDSENGSGIEGQVNIDLGQEKGQENHGKGQANEDLGQEKGQENLCEGQVNEGLEQVKKQVKKQVNLSEKQKEVLIYLLDHPSASLRTCSEATGASAKSIRYTFKKVRDWLEIRHEGPDKTGTWSFELIDK